MKKFLKFIALIIAIIVLYVIGVLTYGTMTDFQPESQKDLEILSHSPLTTIKDSTLSFTIWNIGYGGLGEESDFFFDEAGMFFSKGFMIRPNENMAKKNIDGIRSVLKAHPSDFILLQEVDVNSKRSYFFNQMQAVADDLGTYSHQYGVNYRVDWVPIPIFEPWHAYGKVEGGLASFSKFEPKEATRLQLPGKYEWPTRIFQLDRCLLVQKYSLGFSDKELWVINLHNSAYDKGGALKKQQMAFLKGFLDDAYAKGHYIVVGGDWNQCPPGFQFDQFAKEGTDGYTQTNIEHDFMSSNWQWIFDATTPTNRKVNKPYTSGTCFTTLIDFFLISPNIEVLNVNAIDTDFKYSDHQAVQLEVQLK